MKKLTLTLICFFTIICSFAQLRDSIIANPKWVCNWHQSVLTVNISGGTPPYTYLWSNSSTASSITVYPISPASIYSVTVTDYYSVSNSAQTMIYVDSIKVDSIHITHNGDSVTLGAYGHGGFPPYMFQWSNGQYTPSITVLALDTSKFCVILTDDNDCSDSTCAWIIPSLIKNYPNNNSISLFPNPTSDYLTVEDPQNSTLEIFNIQGQTIIQQQLQQGKTDIDISELAKGVYILRLCSNDRTEVTRIIKE